MTVPGRGLTVSLTLYYNSQVWTEQSSTDMVFNHDADWPAPGWLLSFGRIIQVSSGQGVLQEPDGTLHPFTGTQTGGTFTGHTTDGSLIDYTTQISTQGILTQATAQYPNGKTVTYGACSNYLCYATTITDANGNILNISYIANAGPQIDYVADTLHHITQFVYDSSQRLTVIRTTAYLGHDFRTVVRMHYSTKWVPASGFSQNFHVSAPGWINIIDGLYFPGTSTGYWFGDSDSYSSYGIISKISERRGMTLSATSVYDQGTLTAGLMSRESLYNYPSGPTTLNGPPTFTSMTETWAGMEVPPAVTTYAVNSDANPCTFDTMYPDGTHVTELRYNHPGQFDDGLLYSQTTYDPYWSRLQIDTKWSLEDYDSPCVKSVTVTDQLGQSKTTIYDYYWDYFRVHSTNQIVEIKELDYDGTTVLRETVRDYRLGPGYTSRHIFNLPTGVTIFDGDASNGNLVASTSYGYDEQPLANTPGVLQWTDPATQYRGNITSIARYKHLYVNDPVNENFHYDATGNVIEVSGSCCVDTVFKYTVATQYAYPETITRGVVDPNTGACLSTASCMSRSLKYDVFTGLPYLTTDANGLISSIEYDPASLRVQSVKLPTSATVTYQYDDAGMSTTQTVSDAAGAVASKTTAQLNGLGLTASVTTLAAANSTGDSQSTVISQSYDARGRLWKRSRPHLLGQQPTLWTLFGYDSLGRVTTVSDPAVSLVLRCFDESNRPSSASSVPGETVRTISNVDWKVDCQRPPGAAPGLRERWSRTNALEQLVEVVEPAAGGNGSVFDAGNVETAYSYNVPGLLTRVVQGPNQQERDFQYDPLGRLTTEYLPEKGRTLDSDGNYVGANGQWSDVFSYDDRSNLVWHMDARGIKTVYDFGNDPLNRLFRISYATPGSVDPSSPVLPTRPAIFGYVATGDVTRLARSQSGLSLAGVRLIIPNHALGLPLTLNRSAVEQYGYDSQGRLSTKALFYPGQDPLLLNYSYDSLNRLSEEIYPVESGTASQARKTIDFTMEPVDF
jgi:YD repeat-containing protein